MLSVTSAYLKQLAAVGQGNSRDIDDGAVLALEAQTPWNALDHVADDAAADLCPVGGPAEIGPHQVDDPGDMRFVLEIGFAEAPKLRIGGIVDLEPAVAAEHGDAFVEMVDRLLLHGDQGVVVPLHRELVGHVLEGEGDAAERMRRRHHAEGGLAGRVDQVLEGLDQGHHMADELVLVGSEIRLLGDLAALALGLQHLVDGRLRAQEGGVEAELLAIGAVEEFDAPVGAEDHDAGAERLQHVVMGGDVADQLGMTLLERGLVEGEADHAVLDRHFVEVEQAPMPLHDELLAFGLTEAGLLGAACQRRCGGADLAGAGDHLLGRKIQEIGKRPVAIGDRELGVAPPDRIRQPIEHTRHLADCGMGAACRLARRFDDVVHILDPDALLVAGAESEQLQSAAIGGALRDVREARASAERRERGLDRRPIGFGDAGDQFVNAARGAAEETAGGRVQGELTGCKECDLADRR